MSILHDAIRDEDYPEFLKTLGEKIDAAFTGDELYYNLLLCDLIERNGSGCKS